MATNNSINLSAQGLAYYNGAGTFSAPTVTQDQILVGAASNNLASLGAMTNGQMIIGSTGATPVIGTIAVGAGLAVATGAGTLTISLTGGGFTWTDATNASYTLAVQNGYVANRGTLVTFTLPATAVLGDEIEIVGKGAGGWLIAQNANQQINVGSSPSTVGVGGSVASTNQFDAITLVCITAGASTIWSTSASMGNLTVV